MSKDQSLIYTSSHEGTANIWKSFNGKLVSTLRKQTDIIIYAFCFSNFFFHFL